jgi:thiol-disulfide isomerase/thioredoxin
MNKILAYAVMGVCLAIVAVRPTQSGAVFQTGPVSAAERFQTYSKIGDLLPQFTVTTLDGKRFSSTELKDKVLVINLWATWCAPCRAEMPRLESEVWKNSNPNDFAMLAIAREETNEQITAFRKATGFTFPMAADPDRSIFKLFASGGIPRTYVIGKNGIILYQSLGYERAAFDKLKLVIETELKKSRM